MSNIWSSPPLLLSSTPGSWQVKIISSKCCLMFSVDAPLSMSSVLILIFWSLIAAGQQITNTTKFRMTKSQPFQSPLWTLLTEPDREWIKLLSPCEPYHKTFNSCGLCLNNYTTMTSSDSSSCAAPYWTAVAHDFGADLRFQNSGPTPSLLPLRFLWTRQPITLSLWAPICSVHAACRTLFVDGYDQNGKRMYDPVKGKTCHQCRQKTLGKHTHCSKCHRLQVLTSFRTQPQIWTSCTHPSCQCLTTLKSLANLGCLSLKSISGLCMFVRRMVQCGRQTLHAKEYDLA